MTAYFFCEIRHRFTNRRHAIFKTKKLSSISMLLWQRKFSKVEKLLLRGDGMRSYHCFWT